MGIVHTNNIPVSEKLYNLEVWLPSGTFDMVLSSSSSKVVVLWKIIQYCSPVGLCHYINSNELLKSHLQNLNFIVEKLVRAAIGEFSVEYY